MELTDRILNSLINLGLTKGEAKTYIALVIEQKSEATPLAEIANVPQPKVYSYLKELEQNKLVKKIPTTGKPNLYEAVPFETGVERLRENLDEDLRITHEFIQKHKTKTSEEVDSFISISQGMRGIQTTLELLEKDESNQPCLVLATTGIIKLVKEYFTECLTIHDVLTDTSTVPPIIEFLNNSKLSDFFQENNVGVLITSIDLKKRVCSAVHIIGIPGETLEFEPLMISISHPTIINFQFNMLMSIMEILPQIQLK